MSDHDLILHANCVAFRGKGILIVGPSGSGKSALALQLMAYGAELVADDRTVVTHRNGKIIASPPPTIAGLIEARGVGILPVEYLDAVALALAIDMMHLQAKRLPQEHYMTILDIQLPCLHKVDAPYFPAAIIAYMRGL